ncbi:MAG: preprotein translocase subunit YajC [Candidatus Cloacimonetes bacterium]|jgi:preprotein translocase subunit YajC|nr:preprotein translocase subunit YajC [Candidatus Cloacimonadota bacterium]MCB5287277.1 preprotein translocase subunit YajC [Candidatus Cloacimonadota bacterium]MCK9184563.1 preprotein translocase subunit YajC [Candidatus Cloacimonadota bacterium]MCK9585157.1 preprotein translocase subunit YajC [Candidatus Cloacimonadota bacterium]MDY0229599.1 preprotein translocase subunit YajC [Candidatus Cloacimonadaceae bacterium]
MHYILLQVQVAAADTGGGGNGSMASSLIFFAALFGIMYFLMIRPQQKRQKEMQKMLDSLQVNDKVITSSGIYGRVVSLKPDKDIVVIEIDDTAKVKVDFQRSAIVTILNLTPPVVTK